ncbi:proteinase-activated receptor 3-like [Cetorhinus maximus]
MKSMQTLLLFALISCFINCYTAKECVQKKHMNYNRRFPIIQVTDLTTNKSINIFNDSSLQHLSSPMSTVLLPCLYLVVLIIGLPANGLALYILITRIKKLPATIFLMNLALADLLLTLALPFRVSYHLLGNDWIFGELFCRVCSALFYGNVYSSNLFLTCVSADRYLAVVHPFLAKEIRKKGFTYCICGAVWLLVLLSMLPIYITKQSYEISTLNITTCNDALLKETLHDGLSYYFVCLVVFGFVIPCLITIFCYVSVISTLILNNRQYVHAIKVTLLVLLVFLVCLTPFNVILLIQSYTRSSDIYAYSMFCLALSTFNNCIDPFIYYYISEEFRDKVTSTICAPKNEMSSGKSAQTLIQSSSASQPSPPHSV